MATCKTCGQTYSRWTTPVSARGVCTACFTPEWVDEPENIEPEFAAEFVLPRTVAPTIVRPETKPKQMVRVRLPAFMPRSRSKVMFVVATASYAVFANSLVHAIAAALGAAPSPISEQLKNGYVVAEVTDLLLFAPLVESVLLIGIIGLLRWLRSPDWLQVVCAGGIFAGLHAFTSVIRAISVLPSGILMSMAYLIWRPVSRRTAFLIIAAIHALLNLMPAIWSLGYAARHS